jgi:hypothetical protein
MHFLIFILIEKRKSLVYYDLFYKHDFFFLIIIKLILREY